MRLLVVEDDKDLNRQIVAALSQAGYAVDRAFEEGKTDAMQNKPAKPSYDPATPQYQTYLEGFHSVSEARINGGIKPLKKDVEDKAAIETQRAQDEKAFANPGSGVAMTREEYKRQQAAEQGDLKH